MIVNMFNFLILILFFYGRSLRTKNTHRHAWTMILVIASDFALLLYLSYYREALDKVGGGMSTLLIIHIILALFTMVAYALALINGIQLLAGKKDVRQRMKLIDYIAVPSRTLVFVTSAMLYLSKL